MFEVLNHIDQQFFIAINSGMQNSFLDMVCPIIRNQKTWYLLYALIIFFLYKKFKINSLWILLSAVVLVLISDQLSANLIKNLVQRIRPCNNPSMQSQIHLLVNCGKGYSFVSAHATNHFAIAVFMMLFFKEYKKWLFPIALLWASAIAFSQVYVGVHYPFDVIAGALLGTTLGYFAQQIIQQKIQQQA